jgi:dephospho-CoA kinase
MLDLPTISPQAASGDRPRIIGLTGGLGSGKSTVGRIWETLGVPRWDADQAGAVLYRQDRELRELLLATWGREVLQWNAQGDHVDVNRRQLGAWVFRDAEALARLNGWVHPRVRSGFEVWLQSQTARSPAPRMVLRESAILIESGFHRDCDAVVLVTAPEALRIQRAVDRGGMTADQAADRMRQQWDDEKKRPWVHAVIENGPNHWLIDQVETLHAAWTGNP